MPRENARAKGLRYATEARLSIDFADRQRRYVRARCRGQGHVYHCGYDRRWWCTCPAKGPCAHLVALQLVFALDDPDPRRQTP